MTGEGQFARVRRLCPAFSGAMLSIVAASVAFVVLYLAFLAIAFALVDLLVTKGRLEVPLSQGGQSTLSAADEQLLHELAGQPNVAAAEDALAPAQQRRVAAVYYERGLLPLVWRTRDSWLGTWLPQLYQNVAPLQSNFGSLLLLIGAGLLLGALAFLALHLADRFARAAALSVATRLRREIHAQVFLVGSSELPGRPDRSVVHIFTDDVSTIQQTLAQWWRAIPRGLLLLVVLIVAALSINVWLALTAVLLACLIWVLANWAGASARARKNILEDRANNQMTALVEGIKQSRMVAGYMLEDTPGAPFAENLDSYNRLAMRTYVGGLIGLPLLYLTLLVCGALFALLVGAVILREPPGISFPGAVLLTMLLASAAVSLQRLATVRALVPKAELAASAVFDYLEREPVVVQKPGAIELPRPERQLQFADVVLRNSTGQALLNKLSFNIPVGARVALISSDAHTPLLAACLLARLYDATEGRILIDGQDIREVTLASLRQQTAMVLQDGLLFTATVADNITCGDPRFSVSEIRDAAKKAKAYDFIEVLAHGFSTIIGEHGQSLRPGEALRIGLARALLRDPAILVVEEPAEIDPETAKEVDEALAVAAEGRTLLLLANRAMSIRNSDLVLVFHDGRLAARGTPQELAQSSELYRILLYSKSQDFRLVFKLHGQPR